VQFKNCYACRLLDKRILFLDATLTITKLSKSTNHREATRQRVRCFAVTRIGRGPLFGNPPTRVRLQKKSLRPATWLVNLLARTGPSTLSSGDDGVRTRNLVVANHALSQLSYTPGLNSQF
jgi:hypothetical protein